MSVCEHCNVSRATQHCGSCQKGLTCHKKLCEVSFNASHICNKTKRERDEVEPLATKPDLLEILFRRYKDIVQNLISHLDRWDEVKNICNTNQVMRKACGEFRQLSGGIWQFLMKLYYPFRGFPQQVIDMRDGNWPDWAREHPYIYFKTFLLAVELKYGSAEDSSHHYENMWDDLDSQANESYNESTFRVGEYDFKNPQTNSVFRMFVNAHAIEEDDENGELERLFGFSLELLNAPDDIQEEFQRIVSEGYYTAELTPYLNASGEYVDDQGFKASLESIIEFLYFLWKDYNYSCAAPEEIPRA